MLHDLTKQAKALAPVIRDFVQASVDKLRAEFDNTIELRLGEHLGQMKLEIKETGDQILDLIPEIDADAIAKTAAELVGTPEKGDPGASVDPETLQPMIDAAVQKAFDLVPHGRDALDLDILADIDIEKTYPRNTYARHHGGLWRSHATTDGLRGWECIVDGVHIFHVEQVDERRFKAVAMLSSGKSIDQEIALPTMIYRGVYKPGEYLCGDVATWGGSLWHCDETTEDKPGERSKTWTLCAKKGRDGKSA